MSILFPLLLTKFRVNKLLEVSDSISDSMLLIKEGSLKKNKILWLMRFLGWMNNMPDLYERRLKLKSELDLLSTNEIEGLLRRTRSVFL